MATQTLAVVGAAGGVGTTRLTLEFGATLSRAGRDVVIFDAAFETQGLQSYLPGAIEHDVTAVVADDASLEDALLDHPADLPGRLALCPARAPFERLARAKTAGAAQRFERQLAAVSLSCDVVLVDTPPIGSNQAVAAVNAADRRTIVTTDSPRGRDALALTRDRFADLGVDATAVIVNRAGDDPLADGDRAVPEADLSDPRAGPACVPPDESFAPAVARAVETGLGTTLDLEFPDGGRFSGLL